MKTSSVTFSEVREVLTKTLGIETRKDSLTPATLLLYNLPEFDSMSVLKVILALEDHFNVTIEDDEVNTEVFESLGTLAVLIESKLR